MIVHQVHFPGLPDHPGHALHRTQSSGFGSLVSLPCQMSHASIPAEVRASRELPEDLVRLAVGIEDGGDLEQALAAGAAGAG